MNRLSFLLCLGSLLAGALAARGQDEIHFFSRKTQKEERLKATVVSESASKVTYRVGTGKPEEIPAGVVYDIEYQAPRGVNGVDWRAPFGKERRGLAEKGDARKAALNEALAGYKELLPRLAEAGPHRRQVQFRITQVLAALAENDPAQIDTAIEALKKFKADHADGWQLIPAVKSLAVLQEQKGDADGAQATYEEAADNAALPREVRHEFGVLTVRYLLRKGKPEAAAQRAKALQAAMAREDPHFAKLQVYAAACDVAARRFDEAEKQLRAVLESDADGSVKALARNTLGDCYAARGQKDQAFWQYLWVDVYYNQDRDELARALYQLSKLYTEVRKDTLRARECLDRLCDEKTFGGLDYHKRALAEKSGG